VSPKPKPMRCSSLRHSDKQYCFEHLRNVKKCGNIVRIYKESCKDNGICTPFDNKKETPSSAKARNDIIKSRKIKCRDDRINHMDQCFHVDVQSRGHQKFIDVLSRDISNCNSILTDIDNEILTRQNKPKSPIVPSVWGKKGGKKKSRYKKKSRKRSRKSTRIRRRF
jgi:hypothetical protein